MTRMHTNGQENLDREDNSFVPNYASNFLEHMVFDKVDGTEAN